MRARSIGTALAAVLALPLPSHAAGNVVAAVKNGTLAITGDDLGNEIAIDQAALPAGSFRITPSPGTTVNGGSTPLVLTDVAAISAKLGDGPDVLDSTALAVTGRVFLDAGPGDDGLFLSGTFAADSFTFEANSHVRGNATFSLGDGANVGFMNDPSDVDGDLVMKTKDGDDAFFLNANTSIDGDLVLALGDGDRFHADQVAFGGDVRLLLSGGANEVAVTNSALAGDLLVKTGSGDDTIDTTGTTPTGTKTIVPGSGTNTVTP